MNFEMDSRPQRVLSRRITVAIAVAAVLLGTLALYRTNQYPRTDDAEVFANLLVLRLRSMGQSCD
jgi:multidrug efflux system membrane fusion protein